MENGRIGTTSDTTETGPYYLIAPITTEDTTLEIVLQMANFAFKQRADADSIQIVPEGMLRKDFIVFFSVNFFLFGAFHFPEKGPLFSIFQSWHFQLVNQSFCFIAESIFDIYLAA